MPVGFGEKIIISNDVADWVTILETPEFALTIANTKNQIASSFSGFHTMDGLVEGGVPLQNIPQNKRERISESAFFSKSVVWVWNSDLGNSKLMFIDSWEHSNPPYKTDVKPGYPKLGTARVIDNS